MKSQIKSVASRLGLEIRRIDTSLPLLHEIQLDDLSFPFWLTNQHAKSWWYKPVLEFRAEHRFLKRCCRPGIVAMDVGAHHGIQTIPMSLWAGEHSRVYAFEASRENVITLQANIALNRLKDCVGVYSAVGNKCGTIQMSGESVSEGLSPALETPCCALDAFCAEHDIVGVDFVKIDVEGFERHVLEGAADLLRGLPHLSLELHIDDLPTYGATAAGTLGLIDWDAYEVSVMNRASSWYDTSLVRDPMDVPDSGVVNLFFFNPRR